MSNCVLENERCPKCEALLCTNFTNAWCLNFGRSCDYFEKVTFPVSEMPKSPDKDTRDNTVHPVQLSLNLKSKQ